MTTMQAAICEDRSEDYETLQQIISRYSVPVHCTVFHSAEEFLDDFTVGKYDLIFMDIFMHGMTGVDAVSRIREIDENIPVAFVTTSTEFTLTGYRLDVLKYIEKPAAEKAVFGFLELASLKKETSPQFILKINGTEIKVPFEQILFAEQKGHNLLINLADERILQANERLDTVMPEFTGQGFFRCHKSYLVNPAYIASLDEELMVYHMSNGANVHIRREYLSEARKFYETYLFSKARERV